MKTFAFTDLVSLYPRPRDSSTLARCGSKPGRNVVNVGNDGNPEDHVTGDDVCRATQRPNLIIELVIGQFGLRYT